MNTTDKITPEQAATLVEDVTVEVIHDDDPQNPRKDWDHFSVFVGWHGRYTVGDEQPNQDPEEWWKETGKKIQKEGGVILPVYMMDHGSVSYSTGAFGCPWDSGQVGYIYATAEEIRKNWNCKRITKKRREQVQRMLEGEIETYSQWANGDVWGYTITGGEHDGDSCWGFYGDDLEKSGMKDHVPEELHEQLDEAWENRHG